MLGFFILNYGYTQQRTKSTINVKYILFLNKKQKEFEHKHRKPFKNTHSTSENKVTLQRLKKQQQKTKTKKRVSQKCINHSVQNIVSKLASLMSTSDFQPKQPHKDQHLSNQAQFFFFFFFFFL
jgi:guanylate kinase